MANLSKILASMHRELPTKCFKQIESSDLFDSHAKQGCMQSKFRLGRQFQLDCRRLEADMQVCADTLVGNDMIRGISGGQKKRVTTGAYHTGPFGRCFVSVKEALFWVNTKITCFETQSSNAAMTILWCIHTST